MHVAQRASNILLFVFMMIHMAKIPLAIGYERSFVLTTVSLLLSNVADLAIRN